MAASGKDSGSKDSSPKPGEISPEERSAFAERASEIGKRLGDVKSRQAAEQAPAIGSGGSGLAQAFRFAVELVVGVGVGGFIGWALDRQFGTGPWLLVLFILLGFAAGMLNVIRAAQRAQPRTPAGLPSVRDEDDET